MRKKKVRNEHKDIKNVVLYLRYSDNKQTENSIEGQRKKCEEYARAHSYTIVREYVDRAKSGRTDNRYYFSKMMDDCEKNSSMPFWYMHSAASEEIHFKFSPTKVALKAMVCACYQ